MIMSGIILVLSYYLIDQFSQETKCPRKHKLPLKEFPKIMEIFTFNRPANSFPKKRNNAEIKWSPESAVWFRQWCLSARWGGNMARWPHRWTSTHCSVLLHFLYSETVTFKQGCPSELSFSLSTPFESSFFPGGKAQVSALAFLCA